MVGGVATLHLVSKKKKKKKKTIRLVQDDESFSEEESIASEPAEDLKVDFEENIEENEPAKVLSIEEYLLSLEDARGKAKLGGFYQVKKGDTILKIAREALFNTRTTIQDPDKRDAVVEFSVLIDCGPWNQATAGRSAKFLRPGHASLSRGSALGISTDPIYADNRLRMMNGMAPSGAHGNHYAYIWIPMIDLDLFDSENIVTTQDMDWPDTEDGRGHSMIDPPSRILKLGFDDVMVKEVGCGENRRVIESNR